MTKLHIQVTKQYNGQHIVRVDNTIREAFAKKKKIKLYKVAGSSFHHFSTLSMGKSSTKWSNIFP